MADLRRDGADHGRHDLELVSRVIAGDGSANDVRTAEAQIAGCEECTRLDVDLKAIASATRALGRSDRKSTRLNSSHIQKSRMPSSA